MRIAIAYRLLFGAVALLPQDAAAQFAEKKVLPVEIARKVVAAAESEAARNHLAGVLAVVDDGGWPILIERMDHAAYLASVELAPTPPTGSVIGWFRFFRLARLIVPVTPIFGRRKSCEPAKC